MIKLDHVKNVALCIGFPSQWTATFVGVVLIRRIIVSLTVMMAAHMLLSNCLDGHLKPAYEFLLRVKQERYGSSWNVSVARLSFLSVSGRFWIICRIS